MPFDFIDRALTENLSLSQVRMQFALHDHTERCRILEEIEGRRTAHRVPYIRALSAIHTRLNQEEFS